MASVIFPASGGIFSYYIILQNSRAVKSEFDAVCDGGRANDGGAVGLCDARSKGFLAVNAVCDSGRQFTRRREVTQFMRDSTIHDGASRQFILCEPASKDDLTNDLAI